MTSKPQASFFRRLFLNFIKFCLAFLPIILFNFLPYKWQFKLEIFPLIWIILILGWVVLIPLKALFRAFKVTKQKSFKNYLKSVFASGFVRFHFFSVVTLVVLIMLITTSNLESYFSFRCILICGVALIIFLLASWSNFDVVCCVLLLIITALCIIKFSGQSDGPRGMSQMAYFLRAETSKESCYALAGMINMMSPSELYLDERERYGNAEACKLSIVELKELFKEEGYKIKVLETSWWSHEQNRHVNEERISYVSPKAICGCQSSPKEILPFTSGFYNFEKQANTGLSYLDFYHYYRLWCEDLCTSIKF